MPVLKVIAKPGIPDLPDSLNQPISYSFPLKLFGKKTIMEHSFQAVWFKLKDGYIMVSKMNNKVYCFYCAKGFKEKKLKSPNAEPRAPIVSDF